MAISKQRAEQKIHGNRFTNITKENVKESKVCTQHTACTSAKN